MRTCLQRPKRASPGDHMIALLSPLVELPWFEDAVIVEVVHLMTPAA